MNIQYQNGTNGELIPFRVDNPTMLITTLKEALQHYLPDGNFVDVLVHNEQILDNTETFDTYNILPNAIIMGLKSLYIPIYVDITDKAKSLFFNISLFEMGSRFLEIVKNNLTSYNITNFGLTTLGIYLNSNETLLQQNITSGTHFQIVPQVNGGQQ